MAEAAKYSISVVTGASLRGTPVADRIIALDRRNMAPTLRAAGLEFPEERRRETLFHPSNQIVIAMAGAEVAGYIDWCDDPADPRDIYLSSIQIEPAHRGGMLFKLLLARLLAALRSRDFRRIRTHIQKSNARMVAIARKAGFTLQERPGPSATLDVFAERRLIESPRMKRLGGEESGDGRQETEFRAPD